jgi:hypothetical protein
LTRSKFALFWCSQLCTVLALAALVAPPSSAMGNHPDATADASRVPGQSLLLGHGREVVSSDDVRTAVSCTPSAPCTNAVEASDARALRRADDGGGVTLDRPSRGRRVPTGLTTADRDSLVGLYVRNEPQRRLLLRLALHSNGTFRFDGYDRSNGAGTWGGETCGSWEVQGRSICLVKKSRKPLLFTVWAGGDPRCLTDLSRLRVVNVRQRTYLISPPERQAFLAAIANGEEPRPNEEGRFLLKTILPAE